MADYISHTPRRSRLEGLADELVLKILHLLPFASFYCVSQCSTRFKAICADHTFQHFQMWKGFLEEDKVSLPELRVRLQQKKQENRMTVSERSIMLVAGERSWELPRLIWRDMFCRACLEFRQQGEFAQNARWLMERKTHCAGCRGKSHGAMLFPKNHVAGAVDNFCLAHWGYVRLCPHYRRNRREIALGHRYWQQEPDWMPGRPFFRCDKCDSISLWCGTGIYHDAYAAHFVYDVLLPALPDLQGATVPDQEYLRTVREFCKTADDQYLCPHLRLDNPYLGQLLTRAIPHYWGRATSVGLDKPHTREPLRNANGRPFRCGSCRCWFLLALGREREDPSSSGSRKDRILLKVWQECNINTVFPQADFLAKLDPASYADVNVRGPRSRCITWCESPDCATTRLGKREVKFLEVAW